MKPLNLRLRMWDHSCGVTSHSEVQYNKYKLECLHLFLFFLSLSLVTRGGGVSDRVHWNKDTPRFLDIAIKHCVTHLLGLTIILELIILFELFLKFKLAFFVSIASDLQNWKEFLLPWKVALRANYREDKKNTYLFTSILKVFKV